MAQCYKNTRSRTLTLEGAPRVYEGPGLLILR